MSVSRSSVFTALSAIFTSPSAEQRVIEPAPLASSTLTKTDRARLRVANKKLVQRPPGQHRSIEPGVLELRGKVTFKMPMRVMRGRASTATWTQGDASNDVGHLHVDTMRPDGQRYKLEVLIDLSDALMSEIFVD